MGNPDKKFIIFLLLISVIAGIFWCFKFAHDPGFSDDALGYDQGAISILENGLFNKDNKIGWDRPLYFIFLASIYKIFGHSYIAVRIVQILIFVLICLLVYKLVQLIFAEKVAKISGILMALGYPLASFTGILMREVLFSFFIVLLIFSLFKAQKTFKNKWFILTGIFFGLAFLTNMVMQFFIILIIINLFFVLRKHSFKKILLKTSLFVISFLIVIFPWLIFCYTNFGGLPQGGKGMYLREKIERMQVIEKQYFTEFAAVFLADFFALKIDSNYVADNSKYGRTTRNRFNEWVLKGGNPDEIDKIFLSEATSMLAKKPFAFLKILLIDFLKFNTPLVPNERMQHVFAETHPEFSDFVKGLIILIIRLMHYVFLGIITYAIIKQIKNWQKVSWIILIILYFNVIYTFVSGFARYSAPIYPFYFILFVSGVFMVLKKNKYFIPSTRATDQ